MASLYWYHDVGTHELIQHYDSGDSDYVSVHQLVMLREGHDPHKIFAGRDKWHIHHKNEVPWDNRAENLELLTPKEHAKRHGIEKLPNTNPVDWQERFKYIKNKDLIDRKDWKSVGKAQKLIVDMARNYDMHDEVIKDALDILLRYRYNYTLNGSKMSDVAKAAFLLATHKTDSPIPSKIFERDYDHSELMEKYRVLSGRLGLNVLPPTPTESLGFVQKHFQLNDKTIATMRDLLETYNTNGRGTSVMLASAYYGSQFIRTDVFKKYTQEDVAEMFNITKMAIRNHYRDMVDAADQTAYKSFGNAKL